MKQEGGRNVMYCPPSISYGSRHEHSGNRNVKSIPGSLSPRKRKEHSLENPFPVNHVDVTSSTTEIYKLKNQEFPFSIQPVENGATPSTDRRIPRLVYGIDIHKEDSNILWREECTGRERECNRLRIEKALRLHAPTYDELLILVSAIDEELLHISSHSKVQYFDSAMDYHRTLDSGCASRYRHYQR